MLEMLVVFTLLRIISKLALTSEENTNLTQSMNTAMQGIKTVTNSIASIKERNLAVAVAKSIQIRLMMCNVSAVMRILSKIASRKVPVKWDKDGNVTEWEHLDDTNVTKITSIVKTMVQQVDGIAKELMKEGSLDAKALRSAKRRARAMKNMMRHVSGMLKFIMSLSKGPIEYGEIDSNGELIKGTSGTIKGSLGDYLHSHRKQITDNVSTMMDIMNDIAVKLNEGDENGKGMKDYTAGDMRSAKRKTRNIARIVNLLSPIIELIKSLSDGQYNVGTEDKPDMVNLGDFIDSKKPEIQKNLDSLFGLVKHIGDKMLELNEPKEGSAKKNWFERTFTPNKDIRNAGNRASLIGDTLGMISMTLDVINNLALGNVQIGTKPDGSPDMVSMSKFLSEHKEDVYTNLDILFGFITGENGIQSHIEGLVSSKGKDIELKESTLKLMDGFTRVISSILDMAAGLGEKLKDEKTKDLFGTDTQTNLKGTIERLMEGYSVPLNDTTIFSRSAQFKTRLKNLTDYDKLMKRIMDVRQVDNFEKSVKATGDMVNSINSINDSKIDKLNTLMRNMVEFGKTMDESLKEVFDQIIELAEELHYIIEANDRKQNPQNYKNQPQQLPGQQRGNQQQQLQQVVQQRLDTSGIEGRIDDLISLVNQIKQNLPQ
jgi:hypothetical protein